MCLQSGKMTEYTIVTSPSGARLAIPFTDPKTLLPFSVYKSYDRRLGVDYLRD